MIVGYSSSVSTQVYIAKCVHASTVMDARTITSCANGGLYPGTQLSSSLQPIAEAALAEIFDNGTCIVSPAGNGWNGTHNDAFGQLVPFGPFFPDMDDRIIIVSGTDRTDHHQYIYNGTDYTQSHFPEVDICAPGYELLGAVHTQCGGNTWPYYGGWAGTSFASPLTAGICALVLSINPCLGAEDVQRIIKATADPIVDEANYAGLLGAGRINAYQACLMALGYGHYQPITGNEVWTDDRFIAADLIIEGGATLTVTGKLRFADGVKVIVKQGARLILDGGILTKAQGCHSSFWSGIQVWGTTNQHQYPANNPTYQGLLVLKNGARIEHAREAFTNWKPGDWSSRGGVIQVQGAHDQIGGTFLNCRRSAEFMAYQNFQQNNPVILRPNTSYFNYARFVVDDDYRGGNDFYAHISMWQVDGIGFRACTMQNAQSTPGTIWQSSKLGKGIISIDASYTVTGKCTVLLPYGTPCPEANMDRGSMIGLDHGIHAMDGGTGRGFTADNLRFENNVVGAYGSGVPMTVTRNQFVLGDREVALDEPVEWEFQDEGFHRGISTQQSQSFRIEENTFHRANSSVSVGNTAIVIENSRANNTQVYKNHAYDVDIGYVGEGACLDGTQSSTVGHQFLCNTNNANGKNFLVRDETSPSWEDCIRTQQGSNATPAGNTFVQETGVMDASDYKNETQWVMNYWHAGGGSQPLDVTPGWVGVTLATGTNNCPSRFNNREVKLTGALVSQLRGELDAAKSAYINSAFVYNSLLDGGNTDAVVQEVQESWPQDAWDLRNYLLSRSPYLSTEVLVEMMTKNTLPQAMVLEVCLANPEATKKDGFVKWAEYEAPSPLPSYMIDMIAGSWEPKTFRMQLEAEMGQHHADMTVAAELLQASFRVEEDSIPVASMLEVWRAMPNYGARYSEAQVHLRKGDFAAAKAVMDSLSAKYPMKGDREAERDRTLWYIDQLEALGNAGRSIMQLDSGEVAQWTAFAETAADIPGTWARNVLCFGYDICLAEPGGAAGGNKALRPVSPAAAAHAQPVLTVQPNPASTWVAIGYQLTGELKNAHARILDAAGREVGSLPLNALTGQQVWDTRRVPAGVYSVELYNAGSRLDTQRVVVQPAE